MAPSRGSTIVGNRQSHFHLPLLFIPLSVITIISNLQTSSYAQSYTQSSNEPQTSTSSSQSSHSSQTSYSSQSSQTTRSADDAFSEPQPLSRERCLLFANHLYNTMNTAEASCMLANGAKFFDESDPALKLDPINCIGHYQAAAQGQENFILRLYHRLEDATSIGAGKVTALAEKVDRRVRGFVAKAREQLGEYDRAEQVRKSAGPRGVEDNERSDLIFRTVGQRVMEDGLGFKEAIRRGRAAIWRDVLEEEGMVDCGIVLEMYIYLRDAGRPTAYKPVSDPQERLANGMKTRRSGLMRYLFQKLQEVVMELPVRGVGGGGLGGDSDSEDPGDPGMEKNAGRIQSNGISDKSDAKSTLSDAIPKGTKSGKLCTATHRPRSDVAGLGCTWAAVHNLGLLGTFDRTLAFTLFRVFISFLSWMELDDTQHQFSECIHLGRKTKGLDYGDKLSGRRFIPELVKEVAAEYGPHHEILCTGDPRYLVQQEVKIFRKMNFKHLDVSGNRTDFRLARRGLEFDIWNTCCTVLVDGPYAARKTAVLDEEGARKVRERFERFGEGKFGKGKIGDSNNNSKNDRDNFDLLLEDNLSSTTSIQQQVQKRKKQKENCVTGPPSFSRNCTGVSRPEAKPGYGLTDSVIASAEGGKVLVLYDTAKQMSLEAESLAAASAVASTSDNDLWNLLTTGGYGLSGDGENRNTLTPLTLEFFFKTPPVLAAAVAHALLDARVAYFSKLDIALLPRSSQLGFQQITRKPFSPFLSQTMQMMMKQSFEVRFASFYYYTGLTRNFLTQRRRLLAPKLDDRTQHAGPPLGPVGMYSFSDTISGDEDHSDDNLDGSEKTEQTQIVDETGLASRIPATPSPVDLFIELGGYDGDFLQQALLFGQAKYGILVEVNSAGLMGFERALAMEENVVIDARSVGSDVNDEDEMSSVFLKSEVTMIKDGVVQESGGGGGSIPPSSGGASSMKSGSVGDGGIVASTASTFRPNKELLKVLGDTTTEFLMSGGVFDVEFDTRASINVTSSSHENVNPDKIVEGIHHLLKREIFLSPVDFQPPDRSLFIGKESMELYMINDSVTERDRKDLATFSLFLLAEEIEREVNTTKRLVSIGAKLKVRAGEDGVERITKHPDDKVNVDIRTSRTSHTSQISSHTSTNWNSVRNNMVSVNCFVAKEEGYFHRDDLDQFAKTKEQTGEEEGLRPNDFRHEGHGEWERCGNYPGGVLGINGGSSGTDSGIGAVTGGSTIGDEYEFPAEYRDQHGHSCYRFCTTDTVVKEGLDKLKMVSNEININDEIKTVEIFIGGCSHEEAMLMSASEILKKTKRVTTASLCGDQDYLVMTPKDFQGSRDRHGSRDGGSKNDGSNNDHPEENDDAVLRGEPPPSEASVEEKLIWFGAGVRKKVRKTGNQGNQYNQDNQEQESSSFVIDSVDFENHPFSRSSEIRAGFETSRSYPRRLFIHMRKLGFRVDTFSLPWLGVKAARSGKEADCLGVRWVRDDFPAGEAEGGESMGFEKTNSKLTLDFRFREIVREFMDRYGLLAQEPTDSYLNSRHHEQDELDLVLKGEIGGEGISSEFASEVAILQAKYRYRMRYYRQVFWEVREFM